MRIKLLLLFLLPLSVFAQDPYEREIKDNWTFYLKDGFMGGIATVPGNIHTDLLAEEIIPDPYSGMNELELQWIQDSVWIYETSFHISKEDLKFDNIFLEFEGLDTYATIFLNEFEIGQSTNMFLAWENEIKSWLKEGANSLKVIFDSPYNIHKNTAKKLGYQLPASNDAGENKISPWVRKAPYHFGWDWAPKFTTCGIYKPVNLRFENKTHIEDVYIYTSYLDETLAILEYEIQLSETPKKSNYSIEISDELGVYFSEVSSTDFQKVRGKCRIENPKIWWPNGWGEQPLLDFKFKIGDVDSHEQKIGIRMARVYQEKDSAGESLYFEVNGHRIFAKGANYIPQDVFINNKSDQDYEVLILKAKEANFNMLRVWGGGVYERDVFYDLCDKHGILIWQDFMFACSMYPGDRTFTLSVIDEVTHQVKRLRNHPCIAHWNGNNEVNVAWGNWGWQSEYKLDSLTQIEIADSYERLFEYAIPRTVFALDKRTYTHTSPLSNWGPKGDFNSGSMHYWGVWHNREPFENYHSNVGRFMSEYGFQSFPSLKLLGQYIPEDSLFLSSESMKHRQKSYIGNGLILNHVKQYFPEPKSFEEFIELSQLTQAIAYEQAIESHRLNRPHCMGTLYWQLNDCWPGPSWSTIDYSGELKSAHYKVKEMYQQLLPILQFGEDSLIVSISNDDKSMKLCSVEIIEKKASSDKTVKEFSLEKLEINACSTKRHVFKRKSSKKATYFEVTITTETGEVFSRIIIPNYLDFVEKVGTKRFKELYISR